MLRRLSTEGIRHRFKEIDERFEAYDEPSYMKRLEDELKIISDTGHADLFLIIWDIVEFSRKQGIAVGLGRGQVASSLVAYALEMSGVDPLSH
ncbi:MAG: hypothetical protein IH895_09235, partial [Planctomycetes bacterium]|nr:hypothetical protein [Planctomycetota bacterium]